MSGDSSKTALECRGLSIVEMSRSETLAAGRPKWADVSSRNPDGVLGLKRPRLGDKRTRTRNGGPAHSSFLHEAGASSADVDLDDRPAPAKLQAGSCGNAITEMGGYDVSYDFSAADEDGVVFPASTRIRRCLADSTSCSPAASEATLRLKVRSAGIPAPRLSSSAMMPIRSPTGSFI